MPALISNPRFEPWLFWYSEHLENDINWSKNPPHATSIGMTVDYDNHLAFYVINFNRAGQKPMFLFLHRIKQELNFIVSPKDAPRGIRAFLREHVLPIFDELRPACAVIKADPEAVREILVRDSR